MKDEWSISDISQEINSYLWEVQDYKGNWHDFYIITTPEKIVFGGMCNVGFLESGYIKRNDGEAEAECLSKLISELEIFYNDGPKYTNRIVFNERM